jgi:glucose/arabinose dehydrogenase
MYQRDRMRSGSFLVAAFAMATLVAAGAAQQPTQQQQQTDQPPIAAVAATEPATKPPPAEPVVVVTESRERLRVVPIARGLSHPWGMAFLPDGSILVTERSGRLRIIRDGVLDPTPIAGLPDMYRSQRLGGLDDVAIHPRFAENRYVYISYAKEGEKGNTLAVARGRFDGRTLSEVTDILVANAWNATVPPTSGGGGTFGGRMLFGPDGTLYVTVGDRDTRVAGNDASIRMRAQSLTDHGGKVLRVRDDGSIPKDNPFVGGRTALPEIFTYGHRNAYGLAFHPTTGQLFECEFGPMGGDELNVLVPGLNYGWPLVSIGRNYTGQPVSEQSWWRQGMEMPLYVWNPTINPSNILFYTGDRFPGWKGTLIVAGLGSKTLQRLNINRRGLVVGRPLSMLAELGQRFRDIRQGPDGFLYVATEMRVSRDDDADGAVLRIEPMPE